MEKRWYEKNWIIWLFVIFLWPVGLFMLWRYSSHGIVVKGLVTAIFVLIAFGYKGDSSETSHVEKTSQFTKVQETAKKSEVKQYDYVDVATMMEDLSNNAAAAQKKYKGKDLAVTGQVRVIDSDGEYVVLMPEGLSIVGVHCTVNSKDSSQENFVLSVRKGQVVTAYGRITDVGEVLGYSMKVDAFQ